MQLCGVALSIEVGVVVLQLATQTLHRDGQGVFVHKIRPVRPDAVNKNAPGHGLPTVLHQQPQELLLRLM